MDKAIINSHFDGISGNYDHWKSKNYYYYDTLKAHYREYTADDDAVIEFGCGTGEVINAVNGRRKLGLDLSDGMVELAREKFSDIEFHQHDCEEPFGEPGQFDVAILADVIDHITDILKVYASVNHSLKIGGRICITTINPLWDPIFWVAENLGQKMPEGQHNFVPNRYLANFLKLRGFKLVLKGSAFLVPRHIPLISNPLNRIAPRTPLLNRFCAIQTLIAEKIEDYESPSVPDLSCTVVIPCHNEADNIERCIERIPNLGKTTEIIVVDDGSDDDTAEIANRVAESDDRVRVISYQPNRGKGQAVKAGFDNATSDIMMILDADMTVMPEELPLFVEPFVQGSADMVNGTRMIYPMEQQSMRFLNLIGNFGFGIILSWLIGYRISDSLCGTKALYRRHYDGIDIGKDRWGDFELLFGAAEKKLRIVEVPVHYKMRDGGESKMKPFKHGIMMLGTCWRGFKQLKLRRKNK